MHHASVRSAALVAVVATLTASVVADGVAHADEGGVGFWLPGQLGTLAAVPQTPGWNVYGTMSRMI